MNILIIIMQRDCENFVQWIIEFTGIGDKYLLILDAYNQIEYDSE